MARTCEYPDVFRCESADTFEYACMWKYYRGAGSPTTNIFVHAYQADYKAMKYDATNTAQPFVFRNMQVAALDPDDPISGPHGTFLVCDAAPLSCGQQAKKSLFVVSPVEHTSASRGRFFVADHFSFAVNKGVAESRRLQFHRTEYHPAAADLPNGVALHIKCHMPLRFPLPRSEGEFLNSGLIDKLRPYSPELFELFTRHVAPAAGGGSSRTTRARRRRMPGCEGDFDDIWRRLPIHRLLVVGIPSRLAGAWDVTMIVTNRFASDPGNAEDTHVFRVRSTEDVRAEIGKRFEGMVWDDCAPILDI